MEVSLQKIRKSWEALEGYHTMVYFAPEAIADYQQVGLDFILGYFASRSAPMGRVSDKVVTSAFYVFKPELVSMAIPKAWEIIDPDELTRIRYGAADKALRRILGEEISSAEIAKSAEIASRIAHTAADNFAGRPLFAGHCNIAWPEEPHMILFHAQTLIREFRGDGHMLSLVVHEVSPLQALILDGAASKEHSISFLKSTRGWSATEWATEEDDLISKGLITKSGDDLAVTESGRQLKDAVETMTDRLSLVAYSQVSNEDLDILISTGKKFAENLAQANSFIKNG